MMAPRLVYAPSNLSAIETGNHSWNPPPFLKAFGIAFLVFGSAITLRISETFALSNQESKLPFPHGALGSPSASPHIWLLKANKYRLSPPSNPIGS